MEIISDKARSIYRSFGISFEEIKSNCRNDKHSVARTAIIGHLRDDEGMTFMGIGKIINRKHASVMSLYDSHIRLLKEPLYRDLYSGLIDSDWKDIILIIEKKGPYLGRDVKVIYFSDLSFSNACIEYRSVLKNGELDGRRVITNLI